MNSLLAKRTVLILLGTGGVGKTTVAAALALSAARRQLKTAVITVDPARRLRDALGLATLGGKPARLGRERLKSAGLDAALPLYAMVLDVKRAWDGLVERFAKDPATRERILRNAFYQNLTSQFAGSDAYAALEQLYDLHSAGSFDFKVVDTPPAAHAFEFLQAPARLTRLLDSRAARWLFTPYVAAGRFAMRLASQAARFVVRELERFAGANVLTSISEFFVAAAETTDGVVDRFRKTEALLHSGEVRFLLVTTAEEDRLAQARRLIDEMAAERLRLNAIVINRFLDEETFLNLARSANAKLDSLDSVTGLHEQVGRGDRGTDAVIAFLEDYRQRAYQDLARVARFAAQLPAGVELMIAPELKVAIGDLTNLLRLGEYLENSDAALAQIRAAGADSKAAAAGSSRAAAFQ